MEKTLLEYCLNRLRENSKYACMPQLDPEINRNLNPDFNPEINPEINPRLKPDFNPTSSCRGEECRLLEKYLGNYLEYVSERGLVEEYFSRKILIQL